MQLELILRLQGFASILIALSLLLVARNQTILSSAEQDSSSALLPVEAAATEITVPPSPTTTPAPYTLIFSEEPGPDVPTLQELADGATSDDAIVQNTLAYYAANHE